MALLDRDGTINVERHYLSSPDDIDLLPNTAEGMRLMQRLGLITVIVTNQSAVSRGYFDRETLDRIHQRLSELLVGEGISLDGIYVCPHRPEEQCNCRKPASGLALQAAAEFEGDLSRSFVIGDKSCDIELGKRVGATTILVRTGYGAQVALEDARRADYVVEDLLAAAQVIQKLMIGENEADHSSQDNSNWHSIISNHLLQSAEVKRLAVQECTADIVRAANLLVKSLRNGGKILLCGNGGSAADCQHMAAEFVSCLSQDFCRPGLPAIALTTDSSFLTAYTNDFSFEGIFARQVKTLGKPGDVLIGISTSGSSRNVIQAVEEARKVGMQVIALTGSAGLLSRMTDVVIRAPSCDTQHIQETHLAIEHILSYLVERELYGENPNAD